MIAIAEAFRSASCHRPRSWGRLVGLAGLMVGLLALAGCPDDPMTCDDDCSDAGELPGDGDGDADGGSEGVGPQGIDCSACTTDQLCWWTDDFDGTISSGCVDYPASCGTERTCACVNAAPFDEAPCDEFGFVQNTNACSEEEQPLLYCVSTLG